jgi:prepilin-type N-terminal cleavage/methylation domain-containing protein
MSAGGGRTHRSGGSCGGAPDQHRAAAGFSLLECLIALLLVGFAILMATALLNTMTTTAARLAAQQELLRNVETVLAGVRAGALPLSSGPIAVDPGMSSAPVSDLRLALDVEPGSLPDLYQVTVHARCSFLQNRPLHRSVTTLVWRP